MTPLLLISLLAYGLIAYKDLRLGFLLLVGLLPAYLIRFDFAGLPMTALEAMFIILFICWLYRREKRLVDIRGWRVLLLLWIVVATVAMFVAPSLRAAAGIWKAYFIEPVVFFLMANDFLRSEKDRVDALKALAASAIVIGISAIVQRIHPWGVPPPFDDPGTFRSTSFYGFPNAIGLFLAPLAPLFLLMASTHPPTREENRFVHWYWVAAFLFSAAGILLAKSVGAMFGATAGIILLGLLYRKTRWPTVIAAAVIGLVVFAIPASRAVMIQKLTIDDWSGRVRKEMWAETWNMLKDHPIFGAGLSGYPTVFDAYHEARHIEIFQYPHQEILNFWSELGLAGVVVFLLTIVQFFRTLWPGNARNALRRFGLAASMAALLVHGLVDVPYFKNDLSMLFWLIIALAASVRAEAFPHVSPTKKAP